MLHIILVRVYDTIMSRIQQMKVNILDISACYGDILYTFLLCANVNNSTAEVILLMVPAFSTDVKISEL